MAAVEVRVSSSEHDDAPPSTSGSAQSQSQSQSQASPPASLPPSTSTSASTPTLRRLYQTSHSTGTSSRYNKTSAFPPGWRPSSLEDLPDEILVLVFQELDAPSAAQLAVTSHLLQRVSLDFSLPNYKRSKRPKFPNRRNSQGEVLDGDEVVRRESLARRGIFFLGKHLEVLIWISVLTSMALFMLHFGFHDHLNISWLAIGIPILVSFLLFWVVPFSFALLNVDGLFDPTHPLFAESRCAPRAFMPCYRFCARKRRAIKGVIVAALLVTLNAVLFVLRAMMEPPFRWWLAFLPLDLLCAMAPLFFFGSFSHSTAKRLTFLAPLYLVSFIFVSLKLDAVFSQVPFLDNYFFIPLFLLQVVSLAVLLFSLPHRPRILLIIFILVLLVLPVYFFEIALVQALTASFNWHFTFIPLIVLALAVSGWCIWINACDRRED